MKLKLINNSKDRLDKSVFRIFISMGIILMFAGCISSCMNKEEYTAEPLNVLFITADDLNYNSVGAYGCKVPNITPNIDKLAEEGLLFHHAYVNIAVCQPSRQSIMTGRYPHRNGAMGFEPIDSNVPTLQEQLRSAGYLNGILGKERHLKPTEKFCWDYYKTEKDLASGLGIGRNWDAYYNFTKEFLNKAKEEQKPFFLMANSHDPHRPFAGSEQELKAWAEDLPKYTRKISEKEVAVPDFLADLPEVKKEISEYYTSVYRCDQTVGAILKALEESNFADNTLVMFISDNGMSVPFAKSNCYLNSNKTPWIVRWPKKIPPGSIDKEHLISGIDYMPTILEALNLKKVSEMDGKSFLPILNGNMQEDRNLVFTQYNKIFAGIHYPMRGIQTERFGYIANFWSDGQFEIKGDAMSGRTYKAMAEAALKDTTIAKRVNLYKYRVKEELYDFKKDPDGLVNLINDPDFQQEKRRLKKLLHEEMTRSNDPWKSEFKEKFMK